MNGEVFISRQGRHFAFVDNMIKVVFPICTLNWRVNNYVSREGKGKIAETKVLFLLYNFVALGTVLIFFKNVNYLLWLNFSPIITRDIRF